MFFSAVAVFYFPIINDYTSVDLLLMFMIPLLLLMVLNDHISLI